MTVFILIRHASNDFVKEGRLAGRTPGVHINGLGQREAEDLARHLDPVPLEAIYSSPLERAVDTANVVAACHHLDVQIREGLGEGHIGDWQGKLIKELQDTDTWKAMQQNPVGVHPPGGGESIDEVQKRLVATAEEIRRNHPEGVVALVSHADPLKALIAHYLKWDLNNFQRIGISPASASVLVVGDDDKAHLLVMNYRGELPKFDKPQPKKEPAALKAGPPAAVGQPPESSNTESGKDKPKMAESNILYDFNPVDRINTGAIGEPGHRIFYLQGRQGTLLVTLQAEKEQIRSLSSGITEILDKLGEKRAEATVSAYDAMLEEPIEPLFRIGQLGLGYDQEHGLLVVVAYEATLEENPESINVVRFWATREQMRTLAGQAATSVAGGRPICVLCGKPIDPQGHFCPRRNGHGAKATLI
ncbi:MAG: DUF3090 family protein [Anaerolineae bacterium]